jgi:hypothetical protein
MEALVHSVVLSLFSHKKHSNRLDKFFSAVTCYAAISGFGPSGSLKRASTLTSQIAQLIYACRTSQMLEMRNMMNDDVDLDVYG